MAEKKRKTTLITGASGGIGYELAVVAAKHGDNLVLVARNEDKLNTIKQELETKYQIEVVVISMDLSVPGKPEELYRQCHEQGISIDHLVNNAGYGDYKPVTEGDAALYANMLMLNVIAVTQLSTLFVKDMVERGSGRILNVASTAGYQPVPRMAVYGSSKSYVVNFTEALHAELKKTKITATVLSPGLTDTGFVDRAKMSNSPISKGSQATPASVAKAGYEAMLKGKLYVVPGLFNKLSAFSSRLMPSRRGVLAIADMIA